MHKDNMILWLKHGTPFPAVEQALRKPNGLLAAGGDLSVSRLLEAYRQRDIPMVQSRRADTVVESRSAHGADTGRVQGLALAGKAVAQTLL